MGLRLALYQSPIDHPDVVDLADQQPTHKETAIAARHVFAADKWTVVTLEPLDALLKFGGRIVVVKGDDVGQI